MQQLWQATPEPDRADLVAAWLHLTRTILPSMAAASRWPIRLDHCFMRVCLDHACGGVWTAHHRRPAIRYMDTTTLTRALACAEHIRNHPDALAHLNQQSLAWRGKLRP